MIKHRIITAFIFIMSLLLFCCNEKDSIRKNEKDIASKSEKIAEDTISMVAPRLDGVWSESNDINENADFLIENDIIIYFDNLEHPFKFNIYGDTLRFNYSQGVYQMIILKLTQDTLILYDLESEEQITYCKRAER